jgi:hypothetical protein
MSARGDGRWWLADKDRVHERVTSAIERIEPHDKGRRNRYLRHLRLFGNRNIRDLSPDGFRQSESDVALKYNLVKSVIGAAVAKIAASRHRPMALTIEGDYSLAKRAKQMTRFLDGEFSRGGVYQLSPQIFRDAAVMGPGVMKIYEGAKHPVYGHGLIEYERTYPWELRVDPRDGHYGAPRTLYQVRSIDRYVLAEMFDDARHVVMDEKDTPAARFGAQVGGHDSDMVDVFEAWHLPSSRSADDGRHVITVAGGTLLDEPWKRQTFPFAIFQFDRPMLGFWGDGMTEDLAPLQYELNLSLEKLQQCLHLMGVPRTFVERGSKIIGSHLDNDIGTVVEYSGTPPIFDVPASVPPELPGHIAQLKADGFEMQGVSRLGAQSQKPAGITSGRAINAMEDVETGRFSIPSRDYEAFHLAIAHQVVELVSEIAERDGGYKIKAFDHRSVELLDWQDVSLEDDAYQLRMFPTALLPTQPQAKLAAVQEMIASGMMGREDGLRLLDFPDLDQFTALATAPYEIVDQAIERMIERGEYVTPEPYFPLEFARTRVQQAYARERLREVPEENLELLRNFIDDCSALLEPPPPPAAATPGGMPEMAAAPAPEAMAMQPNDAAMPQGIPPGVLPQ